MLDLRIVVTLGNGHEGAFLGDRSVPYVGDGSVGVSISRNQPAILLRLCTLCVILQLK